MINATRLAITNDIYITVFILLY